MRAVAGHDFDRVERVRRWPLREVLLAYLKREREEAERRYTDELTLWALQAPPMKKPRRPPRPPAILRDDDVDA